MTSTLPASARFTRFDSAACARALDARDARFDGLFFVGITSTRIYCRPVCPARVSHIDRRRFFDTAPAAERAGYRPCLRCRPELAPGRAPIDAISRLVKAATSRIEAGALNGHPVTDLAAELGVSARHLRRALEQEFGVSPAELAQTHRLLLAKRLLTDTALPVTRVAFASGFQSLRRFNAAFRDQYRMPPSALRRSATMDRRTRGARSQDTLRLTLAYRAPFDWRGLLIGLSDAALPGVEMIDGTCYRRTIQLDGRVGVVAVSNGSATARKGPRNHLDIELSASLVPVLMSLIPRLRHLFDLDAEPVLVDGHLARTGLASLVRRRPGVRIPGTFDRFDVILGTLARSGTRSVPAADDLVRRIVLASGEPVETGIPALTHLAPSAERIAGLGVTRLVALGVERRAAQALTAVSRQIADGTLPLDIGPDVTATHRTLVELGVADRAATMIALRALYWPDAFPASDRTLLRATGARTPRALTDHAERWRPWRAYAARHLWLSTATRTATTG